MCERICKHCGKPYIKKHHGSKSIYCSRKCSAKDRPITYKPSIKRCSYCDKEYDAKNNKTSKYCSRQCMSKSFKKQNNCKVCNKTINANRKYCSKECRLKAGMVTIECATCGKKYEKRKSEITTYCSKKCLGISLELKIENTCVVCGRRHYISPSRLKSGKKIYCSYRCRNIMIISNFKNNGCKNTSIEVKMQEELNKRGVKYETQHRIKNIAVVDIFIEPNIVVQCDGDYWHSLQDHKDRDVKQDLELMFNGYIIYRFWEKHINKSVEKCVDKIKELH